ncbi:DUF536 domain-containing protein [Enterococcus lactis]
MIVDLKLCNRTKEEKEKLKEIAKSKKKSMNQLILDSVINIDNDSTDDSAENIKDSSVDSTIINVFKDQLESKDKQIDKLQNLLDQQQQLSLQTNKHIEQLQFQLSNETTEHSTNNPLISDNFENTSEDFQKKGFLSRFFKK